MRCVRLLVQAGADLDSADFCGATPLVSSIAKGDGACVWLLVEGGADVNKASGGGISPLWTAVTNGLVAFVRLLLERGAYPNARDEQGRIALRMVSAADRTRCQAMLVGHGARVDTGDLRGAERSVEVAVAVGGN